MTAGRLVRTLADMRSPRVAALLVAGALLTSCADTTTPPPSASPAGLMPIVIDTDLDVSDAGAIIALVLDPAVDVRAITITDAGTGVTKCGSARKVIGYLLDELGRSEIPYACGGADAGADALAFPPEWRAPADTGWGLDIPPRPETGVPETAVELLSRTVQDASAPIVILALGPWTNLAAAASADAGFLSGVAGIHAMAGSVDAPGNVFVDDHTADDRLEWNVVLDPSAFASIFGSDVPISLVPLDATEDVPVTEELKARLGTSDGGGANLVYELWVRVPGRIGEGQQLWDELAALSFVEPDLVSWQDATLAVDASARLDRSAAGREVRVAMSADPTAIDDALVQALARGGPRKTPFVLQAAVATAWDGTTCSADVPDSLAAGIAGLEFTNGSGAPAGVSVIGVLTPHGWSDLRELLRTYDPEISGEQPDWIVVAGSTADETGDGEVAASTATFAAGTYGPVCITGTWPDIEIAIGDPFEVQPQARR